MCRLLWPGPPPVPDRPPPPIGDCKGTRSSFWFLVREGKARMPSFHSVALYCPLPSPGAGAYLMLASVLIWVPVRVRPF